VIYLLDSNSWIHHLRHGPASNVTVKIAAAPPASVFLCSLVLGELIYGALHGGPAHQAKNLALIASLRQQFMSLPFDDRAAEDYGKTREHLSKMGTLIGPNDLIIAATALAHGCNLVSHNTREFSRVPGLLLEDWQIP
jgi:tRNA(fMet)-specific endonuclease VapC